MNRSKDLRKLREKISKVQDTKRFEHTLGVEYTAAALAMRYHQPIIDAQIAGILHDCTKCLSDNKQLKICEENNIKITEIESRNPFLLHGKTGALMAKTKYGIENEDILNAIRFHTTGRQGMSVLEKIIFVADYIEPGRNKAENLGIIRGMAFENLDKALVKILEDTLSYLKNTDGEIDSMTEITLQYYKNDLDNYAYEQEVKNE